MAAVQLQSGRRGLRELAYLSIREAIVTLRIAPGERITEESLSGELGVSRPVLREALQRLQFEQLVDRLDNGRLRVRPIAVADVAHLYSVRSALEQLAIREAVPRLTQLELDHLVSLTDEMQRAEKSDDEERVLDTGGRFHQLIAHIAGNPVSESLMSQIGAQLDRLRHISLKMSTRPHESISEHLAILAALRVRDPDAAATSMDIHIRSGAAAAAKAVEHFTAVWD